jgi:DNA-binding NarL/FixJ family response regulator
MIRIVIVDDHEMVREGLKAILESETDFEVVAESSSADNLNELVEKSTPDVVLLDARLPNGQVSGPEACRRLTATHPETHVLVVSTYSDDALVDACIEAGARGYVIKDIERFELKQSIRAVYRGEGVVSPSVARRLLDRVRENGSPPGNRPPLNEGQTQILRLISEGFSNREIAERVHLSENTVKSHVQEIFRKLEVRNRVEAALRATREGWI